MLNEALRVSEMTTISRNWRKIASVSIASKHLFFNMLDNITT